MFSSQATSKLPLLPPGVPDSSQPRFSRVPKKREPGAERGKGKVRFFRVATTKRSGLFPRSRGVPDIRAKQTSVCFNNHLSIKRSNHKRRLAKGKSQAEPIWRPPSVKGPSPRWDLRGGEKQKPQEEETAAASLGKKPPLSPFCRHLLAGMADTLRRLINNETCRILQEKLESWYRDYYVSV